MGRLGERELTRLSYLMAALVASPQLSDRLIERAIKESDASQPWFLELVREVAKQIRNLAHNSSPTWSTLRQVAGALIRNVDPEKQIVGRLLAAALESAPPDSELSLRGTS